MRAIAFPAIQFYKRRLSPYKGFCCAYRSHLGRFSCSTLGFRAIRMYGVIKGIAMLRQRLKLCGVVHRRYERRSPGSQRGSAPCDNPCGDGCLPSCELPNVDCSGISRYASCCDGCSCDWPERDFAQKANKWAGRNVSRWSNPDYDAAHLASQSELDPVKRVALFIKMNDIVCSDHYVIALAHRPSVVAVANKLSAPPSGTTLLMDTLAHWYKDV